MSFVLGGEQDYADNVTSMITGDIETFYILFSIALAIIFILCILIFILFFLISFFLFHIVFVCVETFHHCGYVSLQKSRQHLQKPIPGIADLGVIKRGH